MKKRSKGVTRFSPDASIHQVLSRRDFLRLLMAGAGGAALSSCGGGGGGDQQAATQAANGVSGPANAINPPTTTVSGDAIRSPGTTVSEDATRPPSTEVSAAATYSPGITIPPAASITDSAGDIWTLVGGRVMKNGINILTGSSVTLALILYLNGIVFAQNSRGVWYQNGVPWKNIGTIDPRNVVKPSNKSLFYGVNGHMAWDAGVYYTMTAEQQLAILKDLGVTMYRCDTADAGMSTTLAMALRGAFAGSGVGIMPVLNPRSSDWNPRGTEATAYSLGYDLAVRCTQPLKGLVTHIECGNELDTVGLQIGGDGSQTSDWNPAEWPSFRGVIRGMIAGVKAVDPTIKCGVNVGTPMAYRALQMLWNGITPNGTAAGVSGAATLQWDYTTYHWYHSSGKIECGGRDNACINVLQVLKDSFNVPIWLTEWGWSGREDSPAAQSAYVQETMASYFAIKDTYNLESIMIFTMIDVDYGLILADGVTKGPAYETFKNFIAVNPVRALW